MTSSTTMAPCTLSTSSTEHSQTDLAVTREVRRAQVAFGDGQRAQAERAGKQQMTKVSSPTSSPEETSRRQIHWRSKAGNPVYKALAIRDVATTSELEQ